MAHELDKAIRSAATKIAKYVEDAATLTVETQYVQVGEGGEANFDQAKPAARTVIKLDGDCQAIVPLRPTSSGPLEVDTDVFALHEKNVATAIQYRASILNALLGVLRGAGPAGG